MGLWGFLAGFTLLFGVEEFRRLRAAPGDVRQGIPARRRGAIVFVVAGALLLVFAVRDIIDASGMIPAIISVLAGLAACYVVAWGLDRMTRPSPESVTPVVERTGSLGPLLQAGAGILAGTAVAMAIKLAWLS